MADSTSPDDLCVAITAVPVMHFALRTRGRVADEAVNLSTPTSSPLRLVVEWKRPNQLRCTSALPSRGGTFLSGRDAFRTTAACAVAHARKRLCRRHPASGYWSEPIFLCAAVFSLTGWRAGSGRRTGLQLGIQVSPGHRSGEGSSGRPAPRDWVRIPAVCPRCLRPGPSCLKLQTLSITTGLHAPTCQTVSGPLQTAAVTMYTIHIALVLLLLCLSTFAAGRFCSHREYSVSLSLKSWSNPHEICST
jgi:hypothetical protein